MMAMLALRRILVTVVMTIDNIDYQRHSQGFGSEMSAASEKPDHIWFTSSGILTNIIRYTHKPHQVYSHTSQGILTNIIRYSQ